MILVTGAAGFVGAHLLKRLSVLDPRPSGADAGSKFTDAALRGDAIPSIISGPTAETKESCGANLKTESLRLRDLSDAAVSMFSNREGMG